MSAAADSNSKSECNAYFEELRSDLIRKYGSAKHSLTPDEIRWENIVGLSIDPFMPAEAEVVLTWNKGSTFVALFHGCNDPAVNLGIMYLSPGSPMLKPLKLALATEKERIRALANLMREFKNQKRSTAHR
jgi:hypothetical protein